MAEDAIAEFAALAADTHASLATLENIDDHNSLRGEFAIHQVTVGARKCCAAAVATQVPAVHMA